MLLHPSIKTSPKDLSFDQEIEWDRLFCVLGSISQNLVDEFRELVSLPLGGEEVGRGGDCKWGVSSE
jgi:hypothetical protein